MILSNIGSIIKEKKDFAIVCHSSPDGDSLGSMLGLYSCLSEIGKNADVFVEDVVPEKFYFLPLSNEICSIEESKDRYDCVFVLDCGDLDRLGSCRDIIYKCNTVINIDHHLTNDLFGHINFVDTNASSVGEIIYQLLKINGFEISKNTAICLYTSIIADTGGFKYSNTTSMTLSIAGDLINTGINFSDINNRVFDIKTITQIKLISKVTSTLTTFLNDKVAIIYLSKGMLEECNATEDDASEFVNFARDISGVEVGVFIKEKDPKVSRVSLRSKNYADVRAIAEKFGGGGHLRAAGCTVEGSIQEAMQIILNEIDYALEVK
jgi:bifunctional oligoribonuclease and PAP phosphatase NrnA